MSCIYALMCFLTPNIIWQFINKNKFYSDSGNALRHIFWTYVFMFYCCITVTEIAGVGTLWDYLHYKKLIIKTDFDLFSSRDTTQYFLNIIMTMPLGFLLPFIWKNFRSIIKVAITGFLFSACIETLQLFNYRVTDIDDLIMNTLGAIMGYIFWHLFDRLLNNNVTDLTLYDKREPIIYIGFGVLGIFFLYNWRIFG